MIGKPLKRLAMPALEESELPSFGDGAYWEAPNL